VRKNTVLAKEAYSWYSTVTT